MTGYNRLYSDWKDKPDLSTPITAAKLNLIDQAVYDLKRQVFNVRDYGAAGDGAADDTAECQAAVDAAVAAGGGIVFFPTGAYVITQQGTADGLNWGLVVTGDNITFCGVGPASIVRASGDVTILMADGSAAAAGVAAWHDHWVFRPAPTAHPVYAINAAAKGAVAVTLTVSGNAANFNVGDYLVVRAGQTTAASSEQPDAEIARVTAKAGAVLTLDRPLTKAYAAENYPTGHASAGSPAPFGVQNFRGTSGARALIRNLTLRDMRFEQPSGSTFAAINIAQADGVTIENCELEGTQSGFTTSRVRNLRARDNRIRLTAAAWQWGFSPDTGTTDVVIEGNVISSAGAAHIHVHEGPAQVKIRDNFILSGGVTGEAPAVDIRARGYDIEVVGNTIVGGGTTGAAIFADATVVGGGVIADNNIYVPGLSGVGIGVNGSAWTVNPSDTMVPRAVAIGDPASPYAGLVAGPQQSVRYMAWLTKNHTTATVFNLPYWFVVESCTLYVQEAFNSSGTDLVNVGNATWGTNAYASAIDVSTTGLKTGTPFFPGAPFPAAGVTVVATYTNGGTAPTTGKVLVVLAGFTAPYQPS